MRNRIGFVAIVALAALGTPATADEWRWPTAEDYPCASGRFVAHVTPPKYLEKVSPSLEVFEIRDGQRISVWRCTLGNERAPVEVYLSDDGRHVITVNEHGALGFGAYVVAFYGETGSIRHYTIEEVLRLPPPLSRSEVEALLKKAADPNCTSEERTRVSQILKERRSVDLLVPRSTSSRWWDRNSIKFIDARGGKLCFCIWVHLFNRWLAWDAATGAEIAIDAAMTQRWNDRARQWSLKQIQGKQGDDTPYEFLGKLKNPDDRSLIESVLSDSAFRNTGTRSVQLPSSGTQGEQRLEWYETSSANRSLAERLLARWDNRDAEQSPSGRQLLYRLGRVDGQVTLPQAESLSNVVLWVYLVPVSVSKDRWNDAAPVHRLAAPFGDYSLRYFDLAHAEKFPFAISTVTPGQYWIKAVLDRTEPLSKATDPIYAPQPGDYESTESPVVTVMAGKAENVSVDCTHKVTDGTD